MQLNPAARYVGGPPLGMTRTVAHANRASVAHIAYECHVIYANRIARCQRFPLDVDHDNQLCALCETNRIVEGSECGNCGEGAFSAADQRLNVCGIYARQLS